ncbi:MAG: preprotein translocase subunit SecG [Patescibacteria group bacterium]
MNFIANTLPFFQIILSIALIALILLQRSEAGVGGTFGGGEGGSGHFARRGMEKILFNSTVIVALLFALSSFLAFYFGA